ncbi:MAG: methionine--tRNA ligase subunit beta [Thermoplasmataceae archaeon]
MSDEISIDDFRKIEFRTGKVVECEKVPRSRSLLRIIVDLGEERRQIISSISEFYSPEDLLGKTIVVVTNLKKATFMGLESQGMLLAVERDNFLSLITTDRESPPGLRVS